MELAESTLTSGFFFLVRTLNLRIGCVLGFIVSSTLLFGVLNSSANTLLICFAADPFKFHKNHPELSQDLRRAWSQQVWEPTTA